MNLINKAIAAAENDELAENHGLDCFTYTPFARALEKEFIAAQTKQGEQACRTQAQNSQRR